ncbi:hypothetical protein RN001_008941 [Aquatica leii]|uniref:MD-2-related lipid-recognition domain-containing protein n=1 Tax=Aquatica leii TaxID=1421715 RepID=A0AAN7P4X0_9COLE|nr:hypothetical protein RN001_008941 [Aquatica leii]
MSKKLSGAQRQKLNKESELARETLLSKVPKLTNFVNTSSSTPAPEAVTVCDPPVPSTSFQGTGEEIPVVPTNIEDTSDNQESSDTFDNDQASTIEYAESDESPWDPTMSDDNLNTEAECSTVEKLPTKKTVGTYVAVIYNKKYYPGQITKIDDKGAIVNVMTQYGSSTNKVEVHQFDIKNCDIKFCILPKGIDLSVAINATTYEDISTLRVKSTIKYLGILLPIVIVKEFNANSLLGPSVSANQMITVNFTFQMPFAIPSGKYEFTSELFNQNGSIYCGVATSSQTLTKALTEARDNRNDLFACRKYKRIRIKMLTMATMKYPNVSGGSNMAVSGNGPHVDDVDSLFSSSCWQNSASNVQNDFMDTQKLILDSSINNLGSDKLLLDNSINQDNEIATKATMDALDNLLLNSQPINANLAELKPLPPFTGYTGHLSINGIQGHHYHALSQRIPEENNNTYNSFNEQNSLVSSSTCNVNSDSTDENGTKPIYGVDEVVGNVKIGYADCVNPDSVSGTKIYDECGQPNADSVTHIKTEIAEYDISSIDDIATLIGSAIADTTVPNHTHEEDPSGSRDSWMDLDAWIEGACNDQQKSLIITQDGLSEFVIQNSPHNNNEFSKAQIEYNTKLHSPPGNSTLQSLLTHGYMPLLQNRLQNGPPIKQEAPSSTNYGLESSTTSSPPSVVSTTDNLILSINGRFMHHYSVHGLQNDDRIRSPDILGQNYPHTTTTTPNTKKSRSRAQKKQQTASSNVFQTEQNLGLLGKEKPVHSCYFVIHLLSMSRRGLSYDELGQLLLEITNEQAENSDIGGDSDAETNVPIAGWYYYFLFFCSSANSGSSSQFTPLTARSSTRLEANTPTQCFADETMSTNTPNSPNSVKTTQIFKNEQTDQENITDNIIYNNSEDSSDDNVCLADLVQISTSTRQFELQSEDSSGSEDLEDSITDKEFSWSRSTYDPIKYKSNIFNRPFRSKHSAEY